MQHFPLIYKTFELNIVLQKLQMVIWVGRITLKLTFHIRSSIQASKISIFFLCEDSREI